MVNLQLSVIYCISLTDYFMADSTLKITNNTINKQNSTIQYTKIYTELYKRFFNCTFIFIFLFYWFLSLKEQILNFVLIPFIVNENVKLWDRVHRTVCPGHMLHTLANKVGQPGVYVAISPINVIRYSRSEWQQSHEKIKQQNREFTCAIFMLNNKPKIYIVSWWQALSTDVNFQLLSWYTFACNFSSV